MRWLQQKDEGWLDRLVRSPLTALSLVYGRVAALHRRLYETRWSPRRLPLRVLSVGSAVAGGSGKTPVAAWLAQQLAAEGVATALASRGYKGQRRGRVEVVSDGRQLHCNAARIGDEALWLAGTVPGVPVLVAADRGLAGLRAHAWFGTELLVLDDGFQHHRLAKDANLLVLDGAFGLGNRRVLPRGPLREPLSGLTRAGALLVLDPPLSDEDAALLEHLLPGVPRFGATRRPAALRRLGPGAEDPTKTLDPVQLAEEPVGMLTGIGWPPGFRRTLEQLGARVCAERIFPDHHRYRAKDLRGLANEAPRWVTTEKDALKLRPRWFRETELYVLRQVLDFCEPRALLDWARGAL